LCPTPNIVKIKGERAKLVACKGKRRNAYNILVEKPELMNYLGDLEVDGRIILKWDFEEQCLRMRVVFI
jgi:hypothetical protein